MKRGGCKSSGKCVSLLLFLSPNIFITQWTLSALQLHPWALIVVDEDATAAGTYIKLFILIVDMSEISRAFGQNCEVLSLN